MNNIGKDKSTCLHCKKQFFIADLYWKICKKCQNDISMEDTAQVKGKDCDRCKQYFPEDELFRGECTFCINKRAENIPKAKTTEALKAEINSTMRDIRYCLHSCGVEHDSAEKLMHKVEAVSILANVLGCVRSKPEVE